MILGITDRGGIRREGKIRSGKKDEAKGFPINLPHFLLHDAPGLIPVLGEKPTEIYFTVHSDKVEEVFRPDLRWYSKSELICQSRHNHVDPASGQNMGSVAAFYKAGQNVQGLQQRQFPGVQRSRVRVCAGTSCPEYVNGSCSAHMFLDIVVPQYSMAAVFTLDSTSMNAVLNANSAFKMAVFKYRGQIAGQIFKLYKKDVDMQYQDQNGQTRRRMTPVVHIANVSFAEYEEKFKATIHPEDWEALMHSRNRVAPAVQFGSGLALEGAEEDFEQLEGSQPAALLPAEPAKTDEDHIRDRANDQVAAPYFEQLCKLRNMENTETIRMQTAQAFGDVASMVELLKKKIKEATPKTEPTAPAIKGKKAAVAKEEATAQAPPPAAAATTNPLNAAPLF